MTATRTIDTNILVRLFARDDEAQLSVASGIVSRYRLLVLSTVLLETEWVLRSRYRFDRIRIAEVFGAMLTSEVFVFTERERVIRTLDGFERGLEFADAFHLAAVSPGETFPTFDKDLARLASRHMNSVSVELAL